MNAYIANTDYDWYLHLSRLHDLDEVNFWQPSGGRAFRAVPPGAPFLFKLKKPYYSICGFGYLGHTSIMPAWQAWDFFREKNGAASLGEMTARIRKYRRNKREEGADFHIGCLMIVEPTFFPREQWVDPPRSWSKNIVQSAGYDLSRGEGARIWLACRSRVPGRERDRLVLEPGPPRFGDPALITPRLGQGTFRSLVVDAYGKACAVSGEHSLPVLDAAHIRPFSEGGEHAPRNGILLRTDIHRLFDKGYVTVTPDRRFLVSRRLRDDYANGRSYYGFHGREIGLPRNDAYAPDRRLLQWHNDTRFLG